MEASFPSVWVTGEVSNVSRPRSGHIYLTLKDENAQIGAVIWRATSSRVRFELKDGLEVLCQGEINVYPPHGKYQLKINQIQPKGIGALQLAFQQLHAKLSAEGLFEPRHKRPLPRFPRRVAFVTSPTGAAVRDFLEVLRRRWEAVEVLVVPARVQGEGAAEEIADGIRAANDLARRPDVLIVGRGGGSMEDLWCFNEEEVVRAIFASEIPVVSAVGHEIDVTLSDLVADVRALTPTEAAERILPSQDELLTNLRSQQQRLVNALRGRATESRSRLDMLAQSRVLRKPFDIVHNLAREVDEFESRASRAIRNRTSQTNDTIGSLAARLESLSPLNVLSRGYSVTERDGQIVTNAASLAIDDELKTKLARGIITSHVVKLDCEK